VGLVLLALGLLAFFLVHGAEPKPPPAPTTEAPGVRVALPKSPRPDRLREATGIYILENDRARFSLELMPGGRFRFLSHLQGREARQASGTWSLVGSRLTLVYERINGEALPDGPEVAVNLYRASAVVLKDTGLPEAVVLKKRTMIRQR